MQFTLVTSVAHHANIQAKAPLKVTSLVKRPSELPEKAGDAARVPGMGGRGGTSSAERNVVSPEAD